MLDQRNPSSFRSSAIASLVVTLALAVAELPAREFAWERRFDPVPIALTSPPPSACIDKKTADLYVAYAPPLGQLVVAKINASGEQIWTRHFPQWKQVRIFGTPLLDGEGHVVLTCVLTNPIKVLEKFTLRRFVPTITVLAKLRADTGRVIWTRQLAFGQAANTYAAQHISAQGEVSVSGYTQTSDGRVTYRLLRFNSDGNPTLRREIPEYISLIFDPKGSSYHVDRLGKIRKIDPSGRRNLWSTAPPKIPGNPELISPWLTLLPDGNILLQATARKVRNNTANTRWLVQSIEGRSGRPRWARPALLFPQPGTQANASGQRGFPYSAELTAVNASGDIVVGPAYPGEFFCVRANHGRPQSTTPFARQQSAGTTRNTCGLWLGATALPNEELLIYANDMAVNADGYPEPNHPILRLAWLNAAATKIVSEKELDHAEGKLIVANKHATYLVGRAHGKLLVIRLH